MSVISGTEILLDGGIFKEIQDVVESDKVVTRYGSKPILRVFDDGEQSVYTITTVHASVVCTGDHGWLAGIQQGYNLSDKYDWFSTEDLIIGDRLFLCPTEYGGAEMPSTIINIEKEKETANVYDIEVEFTNEYIANGFISHNFP